MHRGIDLWNDSLCIVGLTCGMFIRDIAKIYSCIFAMHRGIDLRNINKMTYRQSEIPNYIPVTSLSISYLMADTAITSSFPLFYFISDLSPFLS